MNFIICYSSRVGSSALVDILGRLPRFKVPIFEDLDWWYLKEKGLLGAISSENIHDHAAQLFQSAVTAPEEKISVGFKWRIWGDPSRLARMIAENNVMLFNLVRNDIFEFVSSLYLSDDVYGEGHAQFKIDQLKSEGEKNELLDRYRHTMIMADSDLFFSRFDKVMNAERRRIEFLKKLKENGASVITIFYEDFAYKRFHFVNKMIGRLGHDRVDLVPRSYLRKVSSPFPSELFLNRDDIAKNQQIAGLLRAWEDLIYTPEFDVMNV